MMRGGTSRGAFLLAE
ncbi:hypothetical protein OKA27_004263, partial [Escherichia coli]|nr:hypothetical protein [Escherichia coli]EJD4379807.1 hypothetical protein [Escherichia coli]EJZ9614237.1 hypothetical protein [Escherichia coli]